MTVYELRQSDYGVYKCVSKNSLGETESTVRLYGNEGLTKMMVVVCSEHIIRVVMFEN